MSTLGELRDATLLLHLVDVSHPDFEEHIRIVERILEEIGLASIPSLLVLNKIDKVPAEDVMKYTRRYDAIPVSALDRETLISLIERMAQVVFEKTTGSTAREAFLEEKRL
jgi:GTP-binding protein HflX